jgi:hypothetical protein
MRRANDIFIIDEMPDGVSWRFELVVAHEVGHVLLGPFHSKSKESLMYPFIGSDFIHRKITQEEISLLKQRIRR